jgi:hypothetical protein
LGRGGHPLPALGPDDTGAEHHGSSVRQELPALHRLVLLNLRVNGRSEHGRCSRVVIGETHVATLDTQPVRNPYKHVIGHHLAALEDL